MARRWVEGLADVIALRRPCYLVSEGLAEQVTGFHVHRGAFASLGPVALPSVDGVLEGPHRGGLRGRRGPHQRRGDLPRAAAFGIDAVLLAPGAPTRSAAARSRWRWGRLRGAVDPPPRLVRRAARTSPASGSTAVARTLAVDAVPLEEAVAGTPRLALVLGKRGARSLQALGVGRATVRAVNRDATPASTP